MGLFRKNRVKIIKEAHSLIDQYEVLDKEHEKLIHDWNKEKSKAKTAREAHEIDMKYEKLDKDFEKKEDAVYDKYYYKMHREFGDIPLDSYKDLPDKFMDKRLVERLSKRK